MAKIHFYNGGLIGRYLAEGRNASVIESFVRAPQAWERWRTVLSELGPWDSLYDRTGSLAHPLDLENLRPLPALDGQFSQSLEELCLSRALELASFGQRLRLFWSGGIDSTLVVVCFLTAGVPLEQLEVVYTAQSEQEYPGFLATHLPAQLARTRVESFPHHNFVPNAQAHPFRELPCMGDFIDPDCLNVTGGLGDKLFNSHAMLTRFGYANALRPYEEVVPRALFEATAPLVAASPVPVRTLWDFAGWMYLSLYYQDELLQMLAGVSAPSVEPHRRALRVFFDTDGFQQWSMHHRERLATTDPARLKWEAKRLIHAYTRDDDYLRSKLKAGSLKFRKTPGVDWDRPILFLLDDGRVVRDQDLATEPASEASRPAWARLPARTLLVDPKPRRVLPPRAPGSSRKG